MSATCCDYGRDWRYVQLCDSVFVLNIGGDTIRHDTAHIDIVVMYDTRAKQNNYTVVEKLKQIYVMHNNHKFEATNCIETAQSK